jgi:hypothetical protein
MGEAMGGGAPHGTVSRRLWTDCVEKLRNLKIAISCQDRKFWSSEPKLWTRLRQAAQQPGK